MSSSEASNTTQIRNYEAPSADEIREQIEKIVASPIFFHSRRMQRFLKFTVEQALKAQEGSIKEYSIALEVFDKPSSFDPRLDPIVRVEASRLRSKLREYYGGPGRSDPIRVFYRKRSYVPHFENQNLLSDESDTPSHFPAAVQPSAFVSEKSRDFADPKGFRAIAVLPFINLSKSQRNEYFSEAVTAEIINVLNQTVRLNIVARTSVLRFKDTNEDIRDIGNRLGVDVILEGSVRLARNSHQ
jgi:serine/threonine-protein kinase